jgi:hypothetical protein
VAVMGQHLCFLSVPCHCGVVVANEIWLEMQGWWGAPPKRRTEKQAGQYCGVAIVVIAVTLLGLDEGVIFEMHNAVDNLTT